MKNSSILLAAAVMAVVLGTCGEDPVATPDDAVPTAAPSSYSGFLFADDTGVYLVDTLAESHPPQAVGPLRPVDGIDLASFPGLRSAAGVAWSDQPVQLTGTMRDGVLVVSA